MPNPIKWTPDAIREVAAKCSSRAEFQAQYGSAYSAARRNKMMDSLFEGRTETEWTEELIREIAPQFSTRNEFMKVYPGGMKAAVRLGVIDEVLPSARRRVTEQRVRDVAATCTSIFDFRKRFPSEYAKANRLGIVRDIVPFVQQPNGMLKWTESEIRKTANQCSSRVEFIERFASAYHAARRLGIDVIEHSFTQWTRESVEQLAKGFIRKKDFQTAHKGAYVYAHRHGFINELFEDQSRCNTRCCVYIWAVVDDEGLYKIGVTSRNMNTNRIDMVAKKAHMSAKPIIISQVGSEKARYVEGRLKDIGSKEKFSYKFDGCTEFRRLSPSELTKCFEIISEHIIERIL